MTPERFRQVDDLFQAALDRDPAERAAFLDEACAGDLELRQEVNLLLSHDTGGSTQQLAGMVEQAAALIDFEAGMRVGPYVLVRELGHGGMGSVYEARRADDEFQQSVAVKLIRRDRVSDFLISRFRAERQILATLQHPNICSLLDGGTTSDGRPYFVLEYIEGLPLLQYCREKSLEIPERLRLFQSVCAAVQYAHRKLVIHRDLKPANVLVTADGVPKLLDFGIAKLLETDPHTKEAEQTRTELRMMTPDYASPEQVRGEPLTTASDVYSLGVLLYELLAGEKPYKLTGRTLHEIERAVCLHDPPPLASAITDPKIRKRVAGDLENIVAKAMRKEPDRRYTSAEALADDVGRYLNGFPVQARPDSLSYRVGKLLRRNKLTSVVAAMLVVSLVAGIWATVYQARRAERRFQQVRKLANTFLFDFDKELQEIAGATKAREMLVATALEYLDNLTAEASGDDELQWELAEAYVRIANIEGYPSLPNLGRTEDALKSYAKAIQIGERLVAAGGQPPKKVGFLATTYNRAGYLTLLRARNDEALAFFHKGLATTEKAYGKEPQEELGLSTYMNCHVLLSDTYSYRGDSPSALKHSREALRYGEVRLSRYPSDRAQYALASVLGRIDWDQILLGDPEGARKTLDRAVRIREDLYKKDPKAPQHRRELAGVYGDVCLLHQPEWGFTAGDAAQAESYCRKAVELVELNLNADRNDAQSRYDISFRAMNLGITLAESNPREAVPVLERALGVTEGLVKSKFQLAFARSNHGRTLAGLSNAHRRLGNIAEAERRGNEAVAVMEALHRDQPKERHSRQDLSFAYRTQIAALLAAGKHAQALQTSLKAIGLASENRERMPSAYAERDLALAYEQNAAIQRALGKPEESRDMAGKALAIWKGWTKKYPATPYVERKIAGQGV
ncbi:MAG: protein kinase [Bryobacterales bacterium]|nr:protein kinase [Bryobacterales bacterium]